MAGKSAGKYVEVPREADAPVDERQKAALRNYNRHRATQGTFFHCGWCLAIAAVVALVLVAGGQVIWEILEQDHYRRHHGKMRHGRADRGGDKQAPIDEASYN